MSGTAWFVIFVLLAVLPAVVAWSLRKDRDQPELVDEPESLFDPPTMRIDRIGPQLRELSERRRRLGERPEARHSYRKAS